MLRVVTNSNSPFIRTDKNGIQGVSFSHFQLPDRPRRPILDSISTSMIRSAMYRPETSCTAACQPIVSGGKLVLIGTSAVGLLDLKTTPTRSGDAWRRGACPGHRERSDQIAAPGAELGDRRRDRHRAGPRPCDHYRRADASGRDRRRARGPVDRGPHRHVVVLFCRPQSADRLHLSADVELADLSGAHVRELLPRTARNASRSARRSGFICRRRWSNSWRNRRKSWCSAAKNAA